MKKWAFIAVALVTSLVFYGSASARHGTLVASMSGQQEVDAEGEMSGDPDGTGRARVRLLPGQDKVCYRLGWKNIGAPTAAHIHRGEAGSNGDVEVTFFSDPNELPAELSGVIGCASGVSDELSNEIRNNPSGFYVNVHNKDYAAGAIRGQLRHPRR